MIEAYEIETPQPEAGSDPLAAQAIDRVLEAERDCASGGGGLRTSRVKDTRDALAREPEASSSAPRHAPSHCMGAPPKISSPCGGVSWSSA